MWSLSLLTQSAVEHGCALRINRWWVFLNVLMFKQEAAAQWWWWGERPPGATSQKTEQRSPSVSSARKGCLGLWGTTIKEMRQLHWRQLDISLSGTNFSVAAVFVRLVVGTVLSKLQEYSFIICSPCPAHLQCLLIPFGDQHEVMQPLFVHHVPGRLPGRYSTFFQ